MTRTASAAIIGDVAAKADVTVNTKGGSVTATLKKALRDQLSQTTGALSGAAFRFASGEAVVLLTGTGNAAPVRVRRTGENRFEIELQSDDAEPVDAMTDAFLTLKKEAFRLGKLELSEPITPEEWRGKEDAVFAEADRILAAHPA